MATLPPRAEPTHDLLHDLDADLSSLPTGLPASVRAATPPPAVREAELEAPHPPLGLGADPDEPLPAPVVLESTPRPPPIRVRVDQRFPTDEEREAAQEDPGGSVYDAIPDDQRSQVLLQWIHEELAGLRDSLTSDGGHLGVLARQATQALGTLTAERESIATIDKRIASALAQADKRRTDALEAAADRTPLQRLVESPHAGRLAAVLTWVGGMISMGVLDYLGLESEPIFRFVALIWGL